MIRKLFKFLEKNNNDRRLRCAQAKEFLKHLKKDENVRYYQELEDYIRPNPDMYLPDRWHFYYFKILNKEGLEALNFLFWLTEGRENRFNEKDIGKVFCLEYEKDDILCLYARSLDDITIHLAEFYETFGLKMTVEEMKL